MVCVQKKNQNQNSSHKWLKPHYFVHEFDINTQTKEAEFHLWNYICHLDFFFTPASLSQILLMDIMFLDSFSKELSQAYLGGQTGWNCSYNHKSVAESFGN